MKKLLLFVLVVLVLFGGYWYFSLQQSAAPTLNADVYPLYSGATWGEAEATTSPDYGPTTVVQSAPFTDTINIAALSTPFTQYYHDKLTAAGWAQDMMREAGGPGGEVSFYTKGDQFIVVEFHSVFKVKHVDAPSECPCDVTLGLSTGKQVGPTPAEVLALKTYRDAALGFSIILPTPIATSVSDTQYSVDASYQYTAQSPGKEISGVQFTIPASLAAGTNLAGDSYISVEHLPAGTICSASPFMMDPAIKSHALKEGILNYSVASSTDAAVGNRYEEWVYARADANPCIAVRYFIHYAAIENFPPGQVQEFDKSALLGEFDQIRRTLAIGR